jgi:chemotaxis protein methyltransferase CheR
VTGPDFEHFCRLIAQRSGLILGPDKSYLINSRLEPIAKAHGLAGVPALLTVLRTAPTTSLIQACVDAMATHESLFFRDSSPFEQLAATILPQLAAARPAGQALRIWCAACSSGQEPYSIAMLVQEQAHLLGGRRVEIIGTDMVEAILTKARAGLYSSFEVQRGLSPERQNRFLKSRGDLWEVQPGVRAMVSFRTHNLLDGAKGMGPFDVVFCRNVLIYFDQAGKAQVLNQIAAAMAPDAALFLGSAESVLGLTDALALQPGSRGLYRPKARTAAAA